MLTDDKTVIMTPLEFQQLPTYDISLPSGTFVGKRWKRDMRWAGHDYVMGEYVEHPDPGMVKRMVKVIWRDIIVIDAEGNDAGK